MIPKIHPSNFTWDLWRAGTLLELGVQTNRYHEIVGNRKLLKKYAIGYCKASKLSLRPKSGQYAVMFQKDDDGFVLIFWTHLTAAEFKKVKGIK